MEECILLICITLYIGSKVRKNRIRANEVSYLL